MARACATAIAEAQAEVSRAVARTKQEAQDAEAKRSRAAEAQQVCCFLEFAVRGGAGHEAEVRARSRVRILYDYSAVGAENASVTDA